MKISIIIPIYNGENYIDKTITSLLNQSYTDIELILVNDGSKDKSKSICEKFAKTDDRIIVINQVNCGISAARNSGLDVATGDYISFIDQDDEIQSDIYKILLDGIYGFDFAVAGKTMQLIDKDNNIIANIEYNFTEKIIDKKAEILKLCLNTNRDTCVLHLWNCLFKRSLIENNHIRFNTELKFGHEDSLFNIEYLCNCKKIHVVNGIVYKYFRRMTTSTSLKQNDTYVNDYKRFIEVALQATKKLQIADSKLNPAMFTYNFRLGISLFGQYDKASKDNIKEIYESSVKVANSNKISSYGMDSYLYRIYLTILVFFLKNGKDSMAVKLINYIKK